jgi:hypothetical protein
VINSDSRRVFSKEQVGAGEKSMDGRIPSRRSVIAAAVLAPFGTTAKAADFVGPLTPRQRQQRVFDCRRDAAQGELDSDPPEPMTNGDEDRYPDRRASFSKTLPHNELGEVDPDAYRRWLAILLSGNPAQFADVPRDREAVERLNNPQATYAIDLVGPTRLHCFSRRLRHSPAKRWRPRWPNFIGWR